MLYIGEYTAGHSTKEVRCDSSDKLRDHRIDEHFDRRVVRPTDIDRRPKPRIHTANALLNVALGADHRREEDLQRRQEPGEDQRVHGDAHKDLLPPAEVLPKKPWKPLRHHPQIPGVYIPVPGEPHRPAPEHPYEHHLHGAARVWFVPRYALFLVLFPFLLQQDLTYIVTNPVNHCSGHHRSS